MESLADSIKGNIDHKNLEHFHEFLLGYTNIFTNNIYATKDYTYHNLRGMIQNKDIVVVKGDKDSSVVITKKYVTNIYVIKLDTMTDDGIMKGTYVETIDNTLKELSRLKYRNFLNYERYKDIKPSSNHCNEPKFRPIINQTRTFTYNAAKVI